MPELPEVETVVRGLRDKLVGNKVLGVSVLNTNTIKNPEDISRFEEGLNNKKIQDVNRRGKYIVILLEDYMHLIIHLRMTGQLLYSDDNLELTHLRVVWNLAKGKLYFNDIRKFGTVSLLASGELEKEKGYWSLGVEPLDDDFHLGYLKGKIKGNRPVKSFILDQSVIAGLGNIYADESLYLAKILPNRPINTLNEFELKSLSGAIKHVLAQSIKNKGTTFSDFVDSYGGRGSNQNHLKVYGRGKENCYECGTTLVKDKIGGRTTVFCLNCQK